MSRERIALIVYVDLDPLPGAFDSKESALANFRGILENQINHYNPTVAHAPDSLQPANSPLDMPSIVCMTKAEAEQVINELLKLLDRDGMVTVSDLYCLIDTPSTHKALKYGWRRGSKFSVEQHDQGWKLVLPPLVRV